MEILPSALCWRICVPAFIRIRTIRKSGYFASVLELRPVSRCQESANRSCCSSRCKSICNRGSANPGNRFNTSMPSPGWQTLRSVAMTNTFLLPQPISEESGEGQEHDDRRFVVTKLVYIAHSRDRSDTRSKGIQAPGAIDNH